MATKKPISSISYNSEIFLKEKLMLWYERHIIQAFQYIVHKGEDGDKDHIHFRIEPNKGLDPMDLQTQLLEYVSGSDKPLGCRPFRNSKEEDWFLYAVHDSTYLKQKYGGFEKGEKLPYLYTDIQVSPFYDLDVAFIRAKSYMEHTSASLAKKLSTGELRAMDLVLSGENPFMVNSIQKCLYDNDYQALQARYNDLRIMQDRIIVALGNMGLTLVNDSLGNVIIEKVE